jgi:uroporphyrinogen decarboxylase
VLIKDRSDIDGVHIEPADEEIRYVGFDRLLAREKAAGRCAFAKIGGIYTRAHFMRGEDRLLMDMAIDPRFCDVLFDRIADHETAMALQTLKRVGSWEVGLWVHDNIGNSRATMFSPAMFERYFMPRYARLISACRAAGCRKVYFNSNGNLNGILDLLLDAGFDGLQPLEPSCGMDLFAMRRKYGNRIVFFGGVCNSRILPRGDRAEIERHVLPLVELGSEGGLVIGTHTVGSDIAPETYEYFVHLIRRHGE